MMRFSRFRMPTAIECLAPGLRDDDGAVALGHQLADAEVDLFLRHVRRVDLGALVEVDVKGVGQREAAVLFVEVDVEELSLRAAAELLGVHAHLAGDALLLGGVSGRAAHLCHTRTSSS